MRKPGVYTMIVWCMFLLLGTLAGPGGTFAPVQHRGDSAHVEPLFALHHRLPANLFRFLLAASHPRTAYAGSWPETSLATSSPQAQALDTYAETGLTVTPPMMGAAAGWSVAVDGTTAIAGALSDNNGNGAAYLFRFNGSIWEQQARLVPAPSSGSGFGTSVALSGNIALVGAPFDNERGTSAGAVYVFGFNGTTWDFQVKLTAAADALAFDQFGTSVAFDGTTALIGAPFKQSATGQPGAGAAYLFDRAADGSWSSTPIKLMPPAGDSQSMEAFGQAVAIKQNTALVGKPFTASANAGAAYFFTRTGTGSWNSVPMRVVANDAGNAFDQFGTAVALNTDAALIGAPTSAPAGAAYVFLRNSDGSWNTSATKLLPNPTESAFAQFGASVALSNQQALVGVPCADTGATDAGKAYLFTQNGQNWDQQTLLVASDAAADDQFGKAVALGSVGVFSGAPGKDVPVAGDVLVDAGKVYVYQEILPSTLTIIKQADVQSSQPFTFTSNLPGAASFSLVADGTDANRTTFTHLPGGTYQVTEQPVAGWRLNDLVCESDAQQNPATIDRERATATIVLVSGATVTCQFMNEVEKPTAVTLISFTATSTTANQVTLEWRTGAEVDNAGFNLYRATSPDGPWTKMNAALISARGDAVSGAVYRFIDSPGQGMFSYRLEGLDLYGVRTLYGPVVVRVVATTPSTIQTWYMPLVVQK